MTPVKPRSAMTASPRRPSMRSKIELDMGIPLQGEQPVQRLDDARHEAVVPERVRHQVQREPVDREIAQAQAIALAPGRDVDGAAALALERAPVALEIALDLGRGRVG